MTVLCLCARRTLIGKLSEKVTMTRHRNQYERINVLKISLKLVQPWVIQLGWGSLSTRVSIGTPNPSTEILLLNLLRLTIAKSAPTI